jgi:hypothetical protein
MGIWRGSGFTTIFRPDSPETPTKLPTPEGGENVLELKLAAETLSFSQSLGTCQPRMLRGA